MSKLVILKGTVRDSARKLNRAIKIAPEHLHEPGFESASVAGGFASIGCLLDSKVMSE